MKRIISLLIVILIFCSIIPVSYADLTYTVGDVVNLVVFTFPHKYDGCNAYIPNDPNYYPVIAGNVPEGMYFTHDSTTVSLVGTPAKAGTYKNIWGTCIFLYTDKDGNQKTGYENFYIGTIYIKSPVTPTSCPNPNPNPNPYYNHVTITKSPTDESPRAYGSALFVADAINETAIQWQLHTPGWGISYWMPQDASKLPGLNATTYLDTKGRYVLCLSGIDPSLYGYHVNALFNGLDNVPVLTGYATIYVQSPSSSGWGSSSGSTSVLSNNTVIYATPAPTAVPTPTPSPTPALISLQEPYFLSEPADATAQIPSSVTLNCSGGAFQGTVKYEWYSSPDNDTAHMVPMTCNTSSYTVPQREGKYYYMVGMWAEKDGVRSPAVFSKPVSVTYAPPAVTPNPEAYSQLPAGGGIDPAVSTPLPSVVVDNNGTTINTTGTKNNFWVYVLLTVLALVLAVLILWVLTASTATVGTKLSRANSAGASDTGGTKTNYNQSNQVRCPSCNKVFTHSSTGNAICPECGHQFLP